MNDGSVGWTGHTFPRSPQSSPGISQNTQVSWETKAGNSDGNAPNLLSVKSPLLLERASLFSLITKMPISS